MTAIKESKIPKFNPNDGKNCRLTCVMHIYHEKKDDNPMGLSVTYTKSLKSGEESYKRYMSVGMDWREFDHGWINESSLVVLENTSNSVDINISCRLPTSNDFILRPKSFMVFSPVDMKNIKFNTSGQEAKLSITIIPN